MLKNWLEGMRFVVIIAVFLWFLGFGLFEYTIQKKAEEPQGAFDLIAVFTGGDGRIREGFKQTKRFNNAKLLISGVISKNYLNDIRRAQSQDVASRVILGFEADTTHENVLELKKTIDDAASRKLLFITSDYHMPRCRLLIERMHLGVDIVYFPVKNPHRTDIFNRESFLIDFLEYNKFLVAWGNTQIRRLLP